MGRDDPFNVYKSPAIKLLDEKPFQSKSELLEDEFKKKQIRESNIDFNDSKNYKEWSVNYYKSFKNYELDVTQLVSESRMEIDKILRKYYNINKNVDILTVIKEVAPVVKFIESVENKNI